MKKLFITSIALLAVFGLISPSMPKANGALDQWSDEVVLIAGSDHQIGVDSFSRSGSGALFTEHFAIGRVGFIKAHSVNQAGEIFGATVSPEGIPLQSYVSDEVTRYHFSPNPVTASAVSPDGTRFVVWQGRNENVYVSQSLSDDEWSDPEVAFNGLYERFAITADGANKVIIVALTQGFDQEPQDLVAVTKTVNQSWPRSPESLASGIVISDFDLLRPSAGLPFVSWVSSTGNPFNSSGDQIPLLYFKYLEGSSWSSTTEINSFGTSGYWLSGRVRSATKVTFAKYSESSSSFDWVNVDAETGQVFSTDYSQPLSQPCEYGVTFHADGFLGNMIIECSSQYRQQLVEVDARDTFIKSVDVSDPGAIVVSPSGRWVVRTDFEISRLEGNKWVSSELPSSIRNNGGDWEATRTEFLPNGDLMFVYSLGNLGHSIAYRTLALGQLPRLEYTPKITGSLRPGKTVSITKPSWLSYSALGTPMDISWVICNKAVAKATSNLPTGCALLAGESNLTHTIGSSEKNKFLTLRLRASNASGEVVTFLPTVKVASK